MLHWLTRKRVIWLSITAVVVFLLVDGFGAQPAHEVHTPGATPLAAVVVSTDIPYFSFATIPAGQSISDLRCRLWRERKPNLPCPADLSGTSRNSEGPPVRCTLDAPCSL